MRIRTCALSTYKIGHRDGQGPNPLYPLYVRSNGWDNSCCPGLWRVQPQHTVRHNAASRILLAAFLRGALAGGVRMADIGQGSHDMGDLGAALLIPARVPTDLLGWAPGLPRADPSGLEQRDGSDAIPRAGDRRRLQPSSCKLSRLDVVIEEQPKEPGRGLKTGHVVELKCTMDYDLDRVYDIAESQHRLLVERLSSQPGLIARLHVIPLGVAGGIQHALDPTLLQLGVERKDLARVRRDLHGSALCHTHRVVTARLALGGSRRKRRRPGSHAVARTRQRREPDPQVSAQTAARVPPLSAQSHRQKVCLRRHRKAEPKSVTWGSPNAQRGPRSPALVGQRGPGRLPDPRARPQSILGAQRLVHSTLLYSV
jgi:hypothetical protein